MYKLGIDFGGTNIEVGIVDENYKIVGRASLKTRAPRPAEEIADDMTHAVYDAAKNAGISVDDIKSFGIASPGTIDSKAGMIAFAGNLRFTNVPFVKLMEERTGKRFLIENDAAAAAYGEYIAGVGKGTKNFIAVTLGTGIGGGIVIDGKIYAGSGNAGGELGHNVLVYGGEECSCGRKGCWEAYASVTALIRQTKQAMLENPESDMWKVCGGKLESVNGRTAFDAMRRDDTAARFVVDRYIEYVAAGVVDIINIFQPDMLCIGGGISHEGETLMAPIRKYAEEHSCAGGTVIKAAALGNDAGIIGGAFLDNLK